MTSASKSNFWLRASGLGSVLFGLLLTGFLVSDQTATTTVAGKAIQDLRVGDRVLGENPKRDEVEEVAEVDPSTWLRGSFTMAKPDGDRIDIELLRPAQWFGDARPGDSVELDLAELGAEGTAPLVELRGAPSIQPGEGNVVIGTFKHHSAETVDLLIEGATEPIGVTVNHPIWSEDRQDFVRVDQLSRGERVRTRSGIAQVASITRRGPPEPVYNIEVHGEHVYRVGELGTLVHNAKGIVRLYKAPRLSYDVNDLVTSGFRADQFAEPGAFFTRQRKTAEAYAHWWSVGREQILVVDITGDMWEKLAKRERLIDNDWFPGATELIVPTGMLNEFNAATLFRGVLGDLP